MSTQKISQLTPISPLNSNTGNVAFVATDTQTGISGKITASTLAAGLYANTTLNVGNNAVVFPGVIGQFASNNEAYLQINLQNFDKNGSSDFVGTADIGTDEIYYIDLGIQGSNDTTGDLLLPLDGYLILDGNTSTSPGGNLVIMTETSGKDIIFAQGGFEKDNAVARFVYGTGFHLLKNPIIFADGTSQNTSYVGAATAANAAFLEANAAFYYANTQVDLIGGVNATQNSNILAASSYANSAFIKANNALANTTGIFGGDLTITGNTIIKTSAAIHNANMSGNNQYLIITGTANDAISSPSNPGYTIHTVTDGGNRIVSEAYSNTASEYSSFIGRRARGTGSNPLSVQSGDTIVRFGGNSYGSTKFSQYSDARIEFVATENHTDIAKGTKIRFLNTMDGSNTATEIATFNANTATFTGTVNPQKGFIFTPKILSGSQTAITIDFTTDSMVRATFNSTLTISLSNYAYGKLVEVWLTNTAGNGQTVNFGTLANNSTTGSTSLSVASGRSIRLTYFSIDGDQANTFVAINYA